MARASNREVSSDEAYSSSEEDEERVNDQVNVEEDDEELQAVARPADSNEEEEDVAPDEALVSDDEVVPVEDDADEVALRFCSPLFRFAFALILLEILNFDLDTVRVSFGIPLRCIMNGVFVSCIRFFKGVS